MKNFLSITSKAARLLCLLLLCSFSFSNNIHAQAQDSKGTEFWLAFPGNYTGGAQLSFFITGDQNTTGTVSIPGLAFSAPFSVTAGAITTITLPVSADLGAESDQVTNKGIHVTAGREVTVYGLSRIQATTDAYLALPVDILGTSYINLGYKNTNVVNGTQFAIVATQDGTTVTITPTVATGGRAAGVAYTINLNRGQTYQLRNPLSAPSDLSGTVITSNKAIAVFGSHQCANIPDGFVACDYVVEQLPPTTAWGKNFVTVPLKTRINGDTFRFLAGTDGTVVRVNGTIVATLNKGQYHERILTNASQITATEPILVAQYSNGTSFDGVISDPFMMLVPPFEQYLGNYTISTPASGFRFNFVNVVAPNAAVGSLKLDNVTIPAAAFSAIGSSGFSGAQLDLTLGTHTINGTNLPFGVFVYGFDQADSYGYPGGQSLSAVATVTQLSLSLEDGGGGVGGQKCFIAVIKDQFNNPVSGVRVDYNITGANPGSGFVNTDANGQAKFCYTGTNAGKDLIVASVGQISDDATYEWFVEVCGDGIDNDLDGQVDEGCNVNTFYRDMDKDGFGNTNDTKTGATAPEGYVAQKGDCNDNDATIYPGATELCDSKDNDCDGQTDEGFGTSGTFPEGWLISDGSTMGAYNSPKTPNCSDGTGLITPPVMNQPGYYVTTSPAATFGMPMAPVYLSFKLYAFDANQEPGCATLLQSLNCKSYVKVYIVPGSYTSDAVPSGADILGQSAWMEVKVNASNMVMVPVTTALAQGQQYRLYVEGKTDMCNPPMNQRYVVDDVYMYQEGISEQFENGVPNGWVIGGNLYSARYSNPMDNCNRNRALVTYPVYNNIEGHMLTSALTNVSASAGGLKMKFDMFAFAALTSQQCANAQMFVKCSTWVKAYLVPASYTSTDMPTGSNIIGESDMVPVSIGTNVLTLNLGNNFVAGTQYRLFFVGKTQGCNSVDAQQYVFDNIALFELPNTGGEICGNGKDDNCNGEIDENCTPGQRRTNIQLQQYTNVLSEVKGLQVNALPNPAISKFSIVVNTKGSEPVTLRVTDMQGRVIEVRRAVNAGQTVELGSNYRPGTYMLEAIQGNNREVLKLVKTSL